MIVAIAACLGQAYDEEDEKPGIFTVITEKGLRMYLLGAYTEFTDGIIGKPLFGELMLKVLGFDLIIKDLVIKDITTEDLESKFLEDTLLEFKAIGISIQMHFLFTLRQTTYPYLEDEGEGTINMQNSTLVLQSRFLPIENCNINFQMSAVYSDLKIEKLKMHMTGGLSFLYDSILVMLADRLKELLNNEIGEELLQIVIETANSALISFDMRLETEHKGILSDSSFIGTPLLVDRTMQLEQVGQVMEMIDDVIYSLYDNRAAYMPPPAFLTNNDVQTFISIYVFRSAFAAYLADEQRHFEGSNGNYTLNTIEAKRFFKTGMLISLEFNNEQTGHRSMIELLEKLEIRQESKHNMWHVVNFANIVSCGGELCADELSAILGEIEEDMSPFWFMQGKIEVFDLPTCEHVYLDGNWVLFGCDMLG